MIELLISIETARRHLRLTAEDMEDDDVAADVTQKVDDATSIVIDYLKLPEHDWTEQTLPFQVRSAILLVLGALYQNREGGDPISDAVKSLLRRHRDPALA